MTQQVNTDSLIKHPYKPFDLRLSRRTLQNNNVLHFVAKCKLSVVVSAGFKS